MKEAADPWQVAYEHWEDVESHAYVYSERCGVGPFEVSIPVRAEDDARFTYGRRMLLLVYGPRALSLDNRVETTSRTQTGIAMLNDETAAEHLECRAGGEGDVPVATATTTVTVPPPKRGEGQVAEKKWYRAITAESGELPKLAVYDGVLPPGPPRNSGAIAIFPRGNPFYYADEYWSNRLSGSPAVGISLRFWARRPSNLSGMVFRVVEQRLVANHPSPGYAEDFARRVAAVEAHRKATQPEVNRRAAESDEQRRVRCEADPKRPECEDRVRGRIPPPPQAEVRPKRPTGDVDWVPGYWSWEDAIEDWSWIAGTYVVRAPPKVAVVAPVEPPAAAPPPVVEAPREIEAKIEAPPPPKVEVLPPPPPMPPPNTVWVAGHWELVGTAWRWRAGAWLVAPAGTRYRPPAIRTRGAIRLYVPGRWFR